MCRICRSPSFQCHRPAVAAAARREPIRHRRGARNEDRPDVDDLDARDAGRNVEVFIDVRVDGKPIPVTVRLSYEQASDLATLLEPFRKP